MEKSKAFLWVKAHLTPVTIRQILHVNPDLWPHKANISQSVYLLNIKLLECTQYTVQYQSVSLFTK